MMNQKMSAIYGSTEELEKFKLLEKQYKAVIEEMQKAKEKITDDNATKTYEDLVKNMYKSRLLPIIQEMRVYRDRYRFLPASKLSDPIKERTCPYNAQGMEVDMETYRSPDFSDRVKEYRLTR